MRTTRKIQACLAVLGTVALAASLMACGSQDSPGDAAGQEAEAQLHELTSLVASVLDSPIPFTGSDGSTHVVYELEVRNASPRAATITNIETVSPTGEVLHTLEGQQLAERMVPVGAPSALAADDPSAITTLDAGRTVVVLMDGIYPSRDAVPAEFSHRFHSTLSAADPANKISVLYGSVTERTGEVTLGEGEPVTLAPPLAGDDWLVANGCCAASAHRRGVLAIDGRLTPFERFAIDWVRVDPALDPASIPEPAVLPSVAVSADATTNDAYLAYGEPLLAVADGTVVEVVDGRPEQPPQENVQGLALDEFGGNYLILDIGDGFYAFYAHVKRGTFAVAAGDHVERGQVIGHLGNSGNTTEAHLHFQIGREPTVFTTTNWPYEFTSFDVMGTLVPEDLTMTDTPTSGRTSDALPLQWDVVSFPE